MKNDSGKMDAFTAAWTLGLICIGGAGLAYLAGALGYALLLGVGGVVIIGLTWAHSTFSRLVLILLIVVAGIAASYGGPGGSVIP